MRTIFASLFLAIAPLVAQVPVLVKDIDPRLVPGPGSDPAEFLTVGAWTYFRAQTQIEGAELWRTDGSSAATQLVADIEPGPGSSAPYGFARLGNLLLFVATVGGRNGIYRSDGSAAGTQLLRTYDTVPPRGFPGLFTAGSRVLFRAAIR